MKRLFSSVVPVLTLLLCLLLALSSCLADKPNTPSAGTTLPVTNTTPPATATTGEDTPPQKESAVEAFARMMAASSPTSSLSRLTVRSSGLDTLTHTEELTLTQENGEKRFCLQTTTQRLTPFVIDEDHRVIDAGGTVTETSTVYLTESEAGGTLYFSACSLPLSENDFTSLSVKENETDGTLTFSGSINTREIPSWLADIVTGSLMSGSLTIKADAATEQVQSVVLQLNLWSSEGSVSLRMEMTFGYADTVAAD